MKRLINNQKITIDDHRRGGVHNWDDTTTCVHIHKETYVGDHKVIIRVPLNRCEPVSVWQQNIRFGEIPSVLKREIQEVLNDKTKRDLFLTEVYQTLKDGYQWRHTEKNEAIIRDRIIKAFELKDLKYFSIKDKHRNKTHLIQIMEDESKQYGFVVDYPNKKFSIGELKEHYDGQEELPIYLKKELIGK